MRTKWFCTFLFVLLRLIVGASEALPRFDTVLVDVLHFSHPVFSVEANSDSIIYLVTSRGTMRREGDEFDLVIPGYTGPIAFERSGDEEWPVQTYCLDEERFPPFQEWSRFLNQNRQRVSVAQSSDGLFWVCDGNRLYLYRLIPALKQIAKGVSTRGIQIWHDALWINTYKGLYRNGQEFKNVQSSRSGPLLLHRDTLYSLGEGSLFLHGPDEEIDTLRWKGEAQSFFSIAKHNNELWACIDQRVGVMDETGFDEVWVPGVDLNLIDVNGELWALPRETFGAYRLELGKFNKIPFEESRVNDVIGVDDGYYLATEMGIAKWEPLDNSFVFRDIADGLPSNSVCGLFLASEGDLWASTLGGLCRLNWSKGWVETHLPFTEFNYFSKLVMPGRDSCYFGSMDGVFLLDPSEFSPMTARNGGQKHKQNKVWFVLLLGVLLVFSVFAVWKGIRIEQSRKKAQNELEEWVERGKVLERQAFRQTLENAILTELPGASVESCAETMGMSSRHLLNLCLEQLGMRPSEVLKEVKLATAKKQLELNPDTSLSEIAARVGYSARYLRELMEKSGYITD